MIKAIFRKILLSITETKGFSWLLTNVLPYVRLTTYYTSFKGHQFKNIMKLTQKGDIILCVDNKKLTTLIIGGEFSHAALCVSDNLDTLDMTREDCRKATMFDICKESDRVVVLRCYDWDALYIDRVVNKAKGYQVTGVKYDYSFMLGPKTLYCSELIYLSDTEKRLQVSLDDLAGIGIPYISPTGLYHAKNVTKIYDSAVK